MCGFCGIVNLDFHPVNKNDIIRMTHLIRHRGPDDNGYYVGNGVGLGHVRLSIIDLSKTGHQPMSSDDGNTIISYNGEIYNYLSIRKDLQQNGVHFVGTSDTEVALKAYMYWGTDCFKMFEGMFGFAIWDEKKKQLHLARDRFGIKPVYYFIQNNEIIFGSEIKALIGSKRISSNMCWQALSEYMHYGTALGENTFFDGIKKLLPGHFLTFDTNGVKISSFASVTDVAEVKDDYKSAIEKIRSLLENAIENHLVSDVPIGIFLSGGIDSSAITVLASRLYGKKLNTYSVGFDYDKGVNELAKASVVARHCGTDHHELHVSSVHLTETIENLVRCHDQPFSDMANLPLYLLCQNLGDDVKVVLQGDGGDEIFAGYNRYLRLSHKFLPFLGRPLSWCNGLPFGNHSIRRATHVLRALSYKDPSVRMALMMSQELFDCPPERVFSNEARVKLSQCDPFKRYKWAYSRFAHLDPVQRMLYTDTDIILPDVYFEKVDKVTMAHGIEVRVPMVDTHLASYVMGLPSSLKIRGGQSKSLLRQALRTIVPDEILDAPKTGFGVPFQFWYKEPLADYLRSVLLDPSTLEWGIFDRKIVERCIEEHTSGSEQHGYLLHKLLNLSLWYQFYLR
jgi:asparagine synthase (glutamine-hydrolysing)